MADGDDGQIAEVLGGKMLDAKTFSGQRQDVGTLRILNWDFKLGLKWLWSYNVWLLMAGKLTGKGGGVFKENPPGA